MTKLLKMGAAAAAMTVMTAMAAQAADLPTKKAPVAPVYVPPVFSWTGFYVGVNAGGIWSTGNANVNAYFPAANVFYSNYSGGSISNGVAGFIGGGQAGYNFQSGAAVFGIETDFDGTSLSKSRTRIGGNFYPLLGGAPDYFTTNSSIRLSWLGTTRGRIGFVATPDNRLMFYGTGGLAYGGGAANYSVYDYQNLGAWGGSKNSTRVGWTVGAGAEYAITNNVTVKGEYLYYSLGSSTTLINPLVATPWTANTYLASKVNYNGSIFRAGINYKF